MRIKGLRLGRRLFPYATALCALGITWRPTGLCNKVLLFKEAGVDGSGIQGLGFPNFPPVRLAKVIPVLKDGYEERL